MAEAINHSARERQSLLYPPDGDDSDAGDHFEQSARDPNNRSINDRDPRGMTNRSMRSAADS